MKHLICILIIGVACLNTNAQFYDFMVDGIAYDYLNGESGDEVEVTFTSPYSIYQDNYGGGPTLLIIPSNITYNNRIYYVTSIGCGAFEGCSNIHTISIPNSVTSIGERAFSHCSGIESITVENGNTKYDSRGNCNAIIETATNTLITGSKNTTIPNSVKSIDDYAFGHCSGLTSVTIPNSVTTIGNGAFYNCSGLTSVTIPNSVTTIGSDAFDGTPWFNNQPDGLIYAGLVAYKYKGTMPANTSIAFRDGTISISPHCFAYCSGLTSVTILNSVTSIGDMAFSDCSGLTSVTIPNSVTTIGNGAFSNCSGLTSVTIPNSVTTIGSGAFSDCSGLTSVTIPNSVTTIGSDAFDGTPWFNNQPDGLIYAGLVAYKYKGTMPANTQITIQNNIVSISPSCFYDCSGLTSVIIPNSVTEIGGYSFYICSGLTSVTIPNSVTTIGNGAFSNCSGLTSVTIPNSVTTIGYNAFSRCSGLNEICSKIVDVCKVTLSSSVFFYVPTSCVLKVPFGTTNVYKQAAQWKEFANIQEAFIGKSGTVGDLNCDNVVNGEDVNIMVGQIIRQTRYEDDDGAADLNGDGKVNGIDLHLMINIILGI